MSTLAVVEVILREAGVPLSVREIVERAGESLPTKSKTPDTVVARDLSMDIKRKSDGSTFIRTSPGRYAIREQVARLQQGAVLPVAAVIESQVSPTALALPVKLAVGLITGALLWGYLVLGGRAVTSSSLDRGSAGSSRP